MYRDDIKGDIEIRCVGCGYDLSAFTAVGPGFQCPECGEMDAGRPRDELPVRVAQVWLIGGAVCLAASLVARGDPMGLLRNAMPIAAWTLSALGAMFFLSGLVRRRGKHAVLPLVGVFVTGVWMVLQARLW